MSLETITADVLSPLRHGFFTRKGGASSGVFAGLNCGYGSSDQSEIVAINRARVAQAMDAAPEKLVGIHQTHSADAITVECVTGGAVLPRADAVATATPGLVLTVLTADCAPVLLADHRNGVIGAAHAGWRGALGGILDATLDAMESIGADRGDIVAVLGPTISQRAYEVGPEFFDEFAAEDPGNNRFFANGDGDRLMFDLPSYCVTRLRNAGIKDAAWSRHCTYSDPGRFFSYRRSVHNKEADYGRLISAIRI